MPTAKDIRVAPIKGGDANAVVKRFHYSGKVVNNSQLHFGVFLDGRLEGAMQFGPSLDKRKIQGLVAGTGWNEFIELNRMAFGPRLPRNSESRALGVAFRLIRREYPHLRWVVSFADATQCGDGTIYRASGFVLTGIKPNNRLIQLPTGEVVNYCTFDMSGGFGDFDTLTGSKSISLKRREMLAAGFHKTREYLNASYPGWKALPGFQLRYIYFLDPTARERLTVPIIPFSEIEKHGARMYLGKRVASETGDTAGVQPAEGGSTPTATLHHASRLHP